MHIPDSTPDQIDAAAVAAAQAFAHWSRSAASVRAALLRALGEALHGEREALIRIGDEETFLGQARLNGELDRTVFQLRGFAEQLEAGLAFACTEDAALAAAPPAGRPHLLRLRVPLGPVAMFSASNFPFAFSVLGGDTVSALAAGCPVVVKAHPGHPRLSRAVFALARSVLVRQELDPSLLSMIEGNGIDVGVALVRHPAIAAVAFTGSCKGGIALWKEANARARPIPFYGELGSINPVVAMPQALEGRAEDMARTLAASMEFGCGQICTSPGLVLLFAGPAADQFETALADALRSMPTHAMLSPSMRRNFDAGVARLLDSPGVQTVLAERQEGALSAPPRPVLARTGVANFLATPALQEEVFGPACLLVRVETIEQAGQVLDAIGGSLTVTLWGVDEDSADARRITRRAMTIAGRVVFGGVPTGVAIAASQQHGGPWPASTAPFTTSVGYAAIERFLRPVAVQNAPAWLRDCAGGPC
jgi:acyl-CoA reductase-like NAD-dependent aldehyde dehydrogenase